MAIPAASISIWKDRIVFTSPSFAGEESSRPAMAVVIGTQGPVRISTEQECYSGRLLLVAPNVRRSISADNAGLYSLQLDPTNRICRYQRTRVLREKPVVDLSMYAERVIMQTAADALELPQSGEAICAGSQRILDTVFPGTAGLPPIDPRVEIVASWIWTHVPARTDLGFLADMCGLSESGLAHLFAAVTGSSISQYLLWVKMRKAAEMFVENVKLTEVAHVIGFSDSAHLSRTFKKYFSITPSFLSNPRLVRVQLCDAALLSPGEFV
ncbi:MAG: AraC family transcriptional regulator [Paraburkholderia sp.]|uniref:AraC family transcriptional regulator n=1 Tax=Paraburkholderia sp. TaxID=1926495 RepID=UPI003C4D68AF